MKCLRNQRMVGAICCLVFCALSVSAQSVWYTNSLQGSWPTSLPFQGQARSAALPYSPWAYGSTPRLGSEFSQAVYTTTCGGSVGRYAQERSAGCQEMSIWNEDGIIKNTPGTADAAFLFTAAFPLTNVTVQVEYMVNSSNCSSQSDGQTYKLWFQDRVLQRDFHCSRPPFTFPATIERLAEGDQVLLSITPRTNTDFDANAAEVVVRGILASRSPPSGGTSQTSTPQTARPGYFRSVLTESWPAAVLGGATRSESVPHSDWSYGSTISDESNFLELAYQPAVCTEDAGKPASLFAFSPSGCYPPMVWKEEGSNEFYAQSSISRDAAFRFQAPQNLDDVEISVAFAVRDEATCSSRVLGRQAFGVLNVWVGGVKMWTSRMECNSTVSVLTGSISSLSRRGTIIVSLDKYVDFNHVTSSVAIEVNAKLETTDVGGAAPSDNAEPFTKTTTFFIILGVAVVVVVGGVVFTILFALYRRKKRQEKRRRFTTLNVDDPQPTPSPPRAEKAGSPEFATMPTYGPTDVNAQSPQRAPWVPVGVTPQRPVYAEATEPKRVVGLLAVERSQSHPLPRRHVDINSSESPSPPAAPRTFAGSPGRADEIQHSAPVARVIDMREDDEEMMPKEVDSNRHSEEQITSTSSEHSPAAGDHRRDTSTPLGREVDVVVVPLSQRDDVYTPPTANVALDDERVEVVFSDSDDD